MVTTLLSKTTIWAMSLTRVPLPGPSSTFPSTFPVSKHPHCQQLHGKEKEWAKDILTVYCIASENFVCWLWLHHVHCIACMRSGKPHLKVFIKCSSRWTCKQKSLAIYTVLDWLWKDKSALTFLKDRSTHNTVYLLITHQKITQY